MVIIIIIIVIIIKIITIIIIDIIIFFVIIKKYQWSGDQGIRKVWFLLQNVKCSNSKLQTTNIYKIGLHIVSAYIKQYPSEWESLGKSVIWQCFIFLSFLHVYSGFWRWTSKTTYSSRNSSSCASCVVSCVPSLNDILVQIAFQGFVKLHQTEFLGRRDSECSAWHYAEHGCSVRHEKSLETD